MKAITSILMSFVLFTPAVAQSPEERALSIIEEADRRVSGFHDFSANLTMTIRDADGDERSRDMRILGLEVPDDGARTLLIFDSPRDLRGTSVLTATHKGERTEQWLYLPAIGRARRVATSDRSDSFMGSEFTYEDMGTQEFSEYTYRYLREEPLDQTPAHVVERFPRDEESGYARQVLWLDTSEYRVLRIEFYGGDGERLKLLELDGYQRYMEQQWRPGRMVMSDPRTGRSTTLVWSDYAFETGLTDEDFDPRRLGRPR